MLLCDTDETFKVLLQFELLNEWLDELMNLCPYLLLFLLLYFPL